MSEDELGLVTPLPLEGLGGEGKEAFLSLPFPPEAVGDLTLES